MKIFDISIPVNTKIIRWPGSPVPRFLKKLSLENGDLANDTTLTMNAHTGTHIDAPKHFLSNGKSIDVLPLKTFLGKVFVACLPNVKEISSKELEKLKIPRNTERVLFKTHNSSLWSDGSKFNKNYIGITVDGARWLSKRKFKLIGVDYLSVAKFDQAVMAHQILLQKNIALLEGINLSRVKPGRYQLVCLPLKLVDLEAGPTRAILIKNYNAQI